VSITREALLAVYDVMMRGATMILNSQEEVQPQVLLFDAKGIFDSNIPSEVVCTMHGSDAGKDALMGLIGMLLEGTIFPGKIAIVAYVSEAWMKTITDGSGLPAGRVSEMPDREEAIVISLHTLKRSYMTMLPIKTVDGKRHVDPVPFEGGALASTEVRGRFARQDPSNKPTIN
jgi:hypothetical protein